MRIRTDFFADVDRIKRDLALPVYRSSIKTSVVAEGFVVLGCEHDQDGEATRALVAGAVRHNKPVFLLEPSARCLSVVSDTRAVTPGLSVVVSTGAEVRRVPESYAFTGADAGRYRYVVLVPEDYLLRRFLSHRALRHLSTFWVTQDRPPLVVTCVGLPPARGLLEGSTTRVIAEAAHVILFDRTRTNIVPHLDLCDAIVVPYDYHDYSANIKRIDHELSKLHSEQVYEATLLVEGHPEIYDLVECLPHARREFLVVPAKPLLLVAAERLEDQFGVDIMGPGFVLTSGFHVRHGVATASLVSELDTYLSSDVSVCVMELFLGDLPLVLRVLGATAGDKSVFILTNMFSPEESVFFVANNRFAELSWVDEIKGRFTSLIIVQAAAVSEAARAKIATDLGGRAKL